MENEQFWIVMEVEGKYTESMTLLQTYKHILQGGPEATVTNRGAHLVGGFRVILFLFQKMF